MRTFLNDMSRKVKKTTTKGKMAQKVSKATSKSTSKRTPKKTSSKASNGTPKKTAKKTAGKTAAKSSGKPRSSPRDSSLTQQQLPLAARLLILVAAFGAMVGFAVVLSRLTLEPSAASEALTHSNLRPGDSIRAYLSQPALRDTLKQLGGNIVLGMPFGALLPVLAPRTRGLLRVILATAVVMLLVELVQGALVTGRAFDIDDVILNSTGAMIGYLVLGRWLGRAVHPRRRHWWHRKAVSSSRSRSRS